MRWTTLPEHLRRRVASSGRRPIQLTAARRGKQNKTEARYATWLKLRQCAGDVLGWQFEAVKLRLADGAWYTPDFWLDLPSGAIEVHEVKGGLVREAAMVRFKVARDRFPRLTFRMMQYRAGVWRQIA